MRLKRLEIQGFKSFARPVSLEFGPGITAIVGPPTAVVRATLPMRSAGYWGGTKRQKPAGGPTHGRCYLRRFTRQKTPPGYGGSASHLR